MLSPTEYDVLSTLRDQLLVAGRGTKAGLVAAAARTLRVTENTVYRRLEAAGFDSRRKRRCDAGQSVLSEAELKLVAGVLLASANQKGQRMPVATALDMLHASGQLQTRVHESTVSRQLYLRRMHPDQLALPTPSVQLRSLHPNYAWQIDSTTGAYYYLPGGRLRWMPEDEFYKNKVANLVKAATDLLTRYAATDHTSGGFRVRHYLGGETALNLVDFASWAMWQEPGCPIHGVPFYLMTDPGGANKSQLFRNFCKRLGIQLRHHAAGAARVTGAVEKTHDLVRQHFETRLRFFDPKQVTLESLNTAVCEWANSYCATHKHTRHGRTRYGAWMEIQPQQLRVAASLEALRDAAVKEPETRRVSNTKTIEFVTTKGRAVYDLSLVPGVVAGLKVTVAENPFRAPAIDVLFVCPDTGAETWHVVEPLKTDAWGYRDGAPVIGQEMRSALYSDVDRTRTELTRQAYRTGDGLPTLQEAAAARKAHAAAYAGLVDPMADVKAQPAPAFLPRRSTPLSVESRQVELPPLSHYEAATRLKADMGAAYTPQVYAHLTEHYPAGVPEAALADVRAVFSGASSNVQPLRLQQGGAA